MSAHDRKRVVSKQAQLGPFPLKEQVQPARADAWELCQVEPEAFEVADGVRDKSPGAQLLPRVAVALQDEDARD